MEKKRSGFWAGLMLGALIGATATLLFAPLPNQPVEGKDEEGNDLRRRAEERLFPLLDRLYERYNAAMLMGQDAYARAKEEATKRNGA
ncbi:MAG TPA: YtxH domain-containing protein [Ktedonobacterales bacterium]|jgi:gas vesicle protein